MSQIPPEPGHNAHLQALYEAAVLYSEDAIVTKTLDGIVTSWNKAAETLFGFTAEEITGKPISLIVPADRMHEELEFIQKIKAGEHVRHYETERRRKDGSTIFISLSVSPLKDAKGAITGASKIARDITARKNEETRQALLAGIGLIFNEGAPLRETLGKVLLQLVDFGGLGMAEVWLPETERTKINLAAKLYPANTTAPAFGEAEPLTSVAKGEGLPGIAWLAATAQHWPDIDKPGRFLRHAQARKSGIKSAYGLPLVFNKAVIGVLVLGLRSNEKKDAAFEALLADVCVHTAAEIHRKLLEQELNQVFSFAPDILCIANTDGYFKKVNPAMCCLLEYSEDELLSVPFMQLVHPADREKTATEMQNIINGRPTYYIENRYITKSGRLKWLAWTTTGASEHGVLYCSAKDITEKKELEELLRKANSLARIGGWELDLVKNSVYWSDMTKEIHEVPATFQPDLEKGIQFYKEGSSRALVSHAVAEAIEKGTPWDIEVQIVTAKGNEKWVRVIGETEFAGNKCVRINGSFQEIDGRKKAEIAAKAALEERNTILESIGDAFFAVDRDWTVSYWNTMAEKVLMTPRDAILNRNLWHVFSGSAGSLSYKKYNEALETGRAVRFEDYYPPLGRWYDISAYPAPNGLSVYFKDITERKQSLAVLEESEKKYSEVFHISPLPMWVVNLDTLRFLDVNQATVNHYGYTREEFLSMTLADIRPPSEVQKLVLGIAESKTTGKVTNNIMTHRKKNGELMQVEIKIAPFRFRGQPVNIVVGTDITERLNYIKAIETQNEKLREITWMQSHVVRAPLARLMGLANLVGDASCGAAEKQQYLKYIQLAAGELDGIIRNITDKAAAAKVQGVV